MIIILFTLSIYFELINVNDNFATYCHLMFRFIGFWWVYIFIVPINFNIFIIFIINSFIYWYYIKQVLNDIIHNDLFNYHNDYKNGCIKLMIILFITIKINYFILIKI